MAAKKRARSHKNRTQPTTRRVFTDWSAIYRTPGRITNPGRAHQHQIYTNYLSRGYITIINYSLLVTPRSVNSELIHAIKHD